MTYAQEKKSNPIDAQQSSQTGGATVASSNAGAKDAQMTQGFSLESGAIANTLEKGESAKPGCNPYGTFNYYRSNGALGSCYFGKIDGKPIYEHTVGRLLQLTNSGSTLNFSYTDGDQPRTIQGRLFALGKYQIIPDTLRAAQIATGMKDDDLFSPRNQDICFSKYLIAEKRPAIMNYLLGKGSIDDAARAVAQEWASVGIKPGTINHYNITGKDSGKTSYYAGDGVNSASISYAEIVEALKADKASIEAGGLANNTIVHGNTIATSSPTQEAAPKPTEPVANSAKIDTSNIPTSSVQIDIDYAIRVNKQYRYSPETWKEIQRGVGLTGSEIDGICGRKTCKAIGDWQATNGFTGKGVDGICGPNTLNALRAKGANTASQSDDAQPQQAQQPAAKSEGKTSNEVDKPAENKQFKYFSIAELSHSDTAQARGIDNTPTKDVSERLSALITNCLDPLREAYGAPIRVNSGYRSPAVNKAVGGATRSQHLTGEAADLATGSRDSNKRLYNLVIQLKNTQGFKFDQLINEYNYSWVHVSYSKNQARFQELTIG